MQAGVTSGATNTFAPSEGLPRASTDTRTCHLVIAGRVKQVQFCLRCTRSKEHAPPASQQRPKRLTPTVDEPLQAPCSVRRAR